MKDIRKYFKYLFSLERSSMKYNLKNISFLLEAAGNPHLKTKFIHIAGTNGKGGTASFLASILTEHGLKTGLYTSPHILRFNERIRINGKAIPDSYVIGYLDNYKKVIEKIKPSFFEVNTAIALKYFAYKHVDIAVIESGLGGKLDSTNIIKPELIILTQIAIDHTDYLGNTLEKIAVEKIGIVKPGIDVVISDTNKRLKKLFISKIEPSRLYFLDNHVSTISVNNKSRDANCFKLAYGNNSFSINLSSPLPGNYQVRNIAAAVFGALKYFENNKLKFKPANTKRAVRNVKINTGYRCRFEAVKKNNINYILDISHNPAGIKSALSNFMKAKPDIIIFAMMNDKDYKEGINEILKTGSKIVFTQPNYKRAIPAEVLYGYAKKSKYTPVNNIYYKVKVSDAIELAKYSAGSDGVVLFIGSFFLISEAIKELKIQKLFK